MKETILNHFNFVFLLLKNTLILLSIPSFILTPLENTYAKKRGEYQISILENKANKEVKSHVDRWDLAKTAWTGAKAVATLDMSLANEAAEEASNEFTVPIYNWLNRLIPDNDSSLKRKADPKVQNKSVQSLSSFTGKNDNLVDFLVNKAITIKNSSAGKNFEKILENIKNINLSIYYTLTAIISLICAALIISSSTPYTSELAIVALVVGVLSAVPMVITGGALLIYKFLKIFLKRMIELRRERLLLPQRYSFLANTCKDTLAQIKGYHQKFKEYNPCPIKVRYDDAKSCYQMKISKGVYDLQGLDRNVGKILENMEQKSELSMRKLLKKNNALQNLDDAIVDDLSKEKIAKCLVQNNRPKLRTNFFMMAAISSRTSDYALTSFDFLELPPKQEIIAQKRALGAVTNKFKPEKNVFTRMSQQRSDIFDFLSNGSMPYESYSECKENIRKKLDHVTLPVSILMHELLSLLQGFLSEVSSIADPKIEYLRDTFHNLKGKRDKEQLLKKAHELYERLPDEIKKMVTFEYLLHLAETYKKTLLDMRDGLNKILTELGAFDKRPTEFFTKGKDFLNEQLHSFDKFSPDYLEKESRRICQDYDQYVRCREKINVAVGEITKTARHHSKIWEQKTGHKKNFSPFFSQGENEANFILNHFAGDK